MQRALQQTDVQPPSKQLGPHHGVDVDRECMGRWGQLTWAGSVACRK